MVDNVTVTQEDAIKRRIAAARMVLGMSTLQTRFADRDGEWSLSDLFNNIEARLSPAPEGVDARELLAAAYESARRPGGAAAIRAGGTVAVHDEYALAAIDAALALSRPPAEQARMREAFRGWCELKGLLAKPDRHSLNKQERDLYDALTAALTPPPKGQNDHG